MGNATGALTADALTAAQGAAVKQNNALTAIIDMIGEAPKEDEHAHGAPGGVVM
jgi:hypothetical protein